MSDCLLISSAWFSNRLVERKEQAYQSSMIYGSRRYNNSQSWISCFNIGSKDYCWLVHLTSWHWACSSKLKGKCIIWASLAEHHVDNAIGLWYIHGDGDLWKRIPMFILLHPCFDNHPLNDNEILRFLQLIAKQVWMTSGYRYWKCCNSKMCYVSHSKVPNGSISFHVLWHSIQHKQMTIGIHTIHTATHTVSHPSVIDCQHIRRTTTKFDCHPARHTLHHLHPHPCLINQSAFLSS